MSIFRFSTLCVFEAPRLIRQRSDENRRFFEVPKGKFWQFLEFQSFAFFKAPRLIRKRSDENRRFLGVKEGKFCQFLEFLCVVGQS